MPTGSRPLTPNVAEVTLEFTQDGQYCYNKHHFFDDVGWDEGRLNNLGLAVQSWFNDNIKANISNTVLLTQIKVRDLSEAGGVEISVTTGLPIAGTMVQIAMPNSVTVAIKKATGRAGRSYHGRTYHIGLVRDQVISNTISAGMVTVLRDAYTELMNPGSGLFAPQLCVLSEVSGGAWRPEGISTIVTGISVDNVIDNQRRRLPGRGR